MIQSLSFTLKAALLHSDIICVCFSQHVTFNMHEPATAGEPQEPQLYPPLVAFLFSLLTILHTLTRLFNPAEDTRLHFNVSITSLRSSQINCRTKNPAQLRFEVRRAFPAVPSRHRNETKIQYLNLLIMRCVFSVPANFPSSAAAAVRGGRPIVRANKGRRGHLHFHKSFARGVGEASSTPVCLVWIYAKAFSIKSHHSQSIIKGIC